METRNYPRSWHKQAKRREQYERKVLEKLRREEEDRRNEFPGFTAVESYAHVRNYAVALKLRNREKHARHAQRQEQQEQERQQILYRNFSDVPLVRDTDAPSLLAEYKFHDPHQGDDASQIPYNQDMWGPTLSAYEWNRYHARQKQQPMNYLVNIT